MTNYKTNEFQTRLDVKETNGRTIRADGIGECRVERYTFKGECIPGDSKGVLWVANVITNHGALRIAEGYDHDQVLDKFNEFIG